MPYELGIAGGESARKRAGEKGEKEEPEGGEEGADSGPRVHLSARESTLLSGTTSVYLNLGVILNLYPA